MTSNQSCAANPPFCNCLHVQNRGDRPHHLRDLAQIVDCKYVNTKCAPVVTKETVRPTEAVVDKSYDWAMSSYLAPAESLRGFRLTDGRFAQSHSLLLLFYLRFMASQLSVASNRATEGWTHSDRASCLLPSRSYVSHTFSPFRYSHQDTRNTIFSVPALHREWNTLPYHLVHTCLPSPQTLCGPPETVTALTRYLRYPLHDSADHRTHFAEHAQKQDFVGWPFQHMG